MGCRRITIYWLHSDDIETFNGIGQRLELHPTRTPAEARRLCRYVLVNDEHVDVVVARAATTVEGRPVGFDALWSGRRAIAIGGSDVWVPSLDDLILTKQIAARPKDLEDVRLLRILKEERGDL